MKINAGFERVSRERFAEDLHRLFPGTDLSVISSEDTYGNIVLPKRATAGSAGYDIFTPVPICLAPGETVTVPTGLRVRIEGEWFLMCCPRRGLGFKYSLRLDNTVGIIDSDYYGAENEGHILIKITNGSPYKTLSLSPGEGFAQGIFLPYGVCGGDTADGVRTGGFGSTSSGSL